MPGRVESLHRRCMPRDQHAIHKSDQRFDLNLVAHGAAVGRTELTQQSQRFGLALIAPSMSQQRVEELLPIARPMNLGADLHLLAQERQVLGRRKAVLEDRRNRPAECMPLVDPFLVCVQFEPASSQCRHNRLPIGIGNLGIIPQQRTDEHRDLLDLERVNLGLQIRNPFRAELPDFVALAERMMGEDVGRHILMNRMLREEPCEVRQLRHPAFVDATDPNIGSLPERETQRPVEPRELNRWQLARHFRLAHPLPHELVRRVLLISHDERREQASIRLLGRRGTAFEILRQEHCQFRISRATTQQLCLRIAERIAFVVEPFRSLAVLHEPIERGLELTCVGQIMRMLSVQRDVPLSRLEQRPHADIQLIEALQNPQGFEPFALPIPLCPERLWLPIKHRLQEFDELEVLIPIRDPVGLRQEKPGHKEVLRIVSSDNRSRPCEQPLPSLFIPPGGFENQRPQHSLFQMNDIGASASAIAQCGFRPSIALLDRVELLEDLRPLLAQREMQQHDKPVIEARLTLGDRLLRLRHGRQRQAQELHRRPRSKLARHSLAVRGSVEQRHRLSLAFRDPTFIVERRHRRRPLPTGHFDEVAEVGRSDELPRLKELGLQQHMLLRIDDVVLLGLLTRCQLQPHRVGGDWLNRRLEPIGLRMQRHDRKVAQRQRRSLQLSRLRLANAAEIEGSREDAALLVVAPVDDDMLADAGRSSHPSMRRIKLDRAARPEITFPARIKALRRATNLDAPSVRELLQRLGSQQALRQFECLSRPVRRRLLRRLQSRRRQRQRREHRVRPLNRVRADRRAIAAPLVPANEAIGLALVGLRLKEAAAERESAA